jgi:MFS family permease
MILISITLFFAGCLLAALAKNFTYMLVGRSIQGVGGGGLLALTEVIVTDLVPLRLRGQYLGILNATWTIGSVTGPVLGGGFSENVSWVCLSTSFPDICTQCILTLDIKRWIFYINIPFAVIGFVFSVLFLRLKLAPSSLRDKLRRIDYIGTFLFVASTTSFMIPLSWGGVMYAWSSWHTLVPLIIGAVGLAVFCYYEYRFATHPVIPLEIFNSTTATVAYVGTLIQGLVLWCALYYMPLYFEAVKGYSPIISGIAIFPDSFTVAPSAMLTGFAITYFGKYRLAVWIGWVLTTLGFGLLCILKVDTSTPGWIFLEFSIGFGLGILFPAVTFSLQASATHETLAMAVAMMSFFRSFGEAIGVAIGGVIFQNRIYANLLEYPELAPYAREYSQDSAGLVQVINAMSDGQSKHDLRQAYTDSLRIIWAFCCAISAVALVFSFWTKEYDIDRALKTDQGLQEKKKTTGNAV